jgi:uncharacterized protein
VKVLRELRRIKFVPLTSSFSLRELKDSYFITGYQGFGLVGYITTRYLARELGLRKIGFIKTKYIPDVTMYTRDLDLIYPFEVYAGPVGNNKVVVVVNNAIPSNVEKTAYTEFIAKFAKRLGVKEVILVGGLDQEYRSSPEEKYRWIPLNDPITKLEANILEDRYIVGLLALTMMFVKAYGLKGFVILPFTEPFKPDPRASAVAVDVIGKILGVEMRTDKLMEEAMILEAIEAEKEKFKRTVEELERAPRSTYM